MMASLINVSSRKPQKYFKPFPHQGNKQTQFQTALPNIYIDVTIQQLNILPLLKHKTVCQTYVRCHSITHTMIYLLATKVLCQNTCFALKPSSQKERFNTRREKNTTRNKMETKKMSCILTHLTPPLHGKNQYFLMTHSKA